MIKVQTRLVVADNTGASVAQCINILGHSHRKEASIGDVIVVAIKETPASKTNKTTTTNSSKSTDKTNLGLTKVRKGEVHKALIIRTKVNPVLAPHGSHGLRFDDNAVILLNGKYEPAGTRIFGPVSAFELRKQQHRILGKGKNTSGSLKVLSLAQLSL